MATLQLPSRSVGADNPVFIVAECGINHNGSLDMALEMIEQAAAAGVDAVKFQLFRAEGMYTPDAGLYETAAGDMVPIYELMRDVELPLEWIPELSNRCRKCNLHFVMTVCDEWCVQQMAEHDFDIYKVASYEISHLPMLQEIARRQVPVIMSTGGADMVDVIEAVSVLAGENGCRVGLMQCTAHYPTAPDNVNLSVIETLSRISPNIVPGYSDHTKDPTTAPVQAVYHGAKILEKHFTLDRELPGADHSFAVDPPDLALMVEAVREAEQEVENGDHPKPDETMSGSPVKRLTEPERWLRSFAYRGIFATRDIAAGEVLSRDNLAVLRPGELPQGLHPRYYEMLASGKYVATRDIPIHRGVKWDHILSRNGQ